MRIDDHYRLALASSTQGASPDGEESLHADSSVISLQLESLQQKLFEIHDTVESIDDALIAIESMKEADLVHLGLVEACLNLVQRGTALTAENIQPGLEGFVGTQVSTEGIKETVKSMLMAIQRMLRELWHLIREFFVTVVNEVGRARMRLQYSRTLVDEIDGKNPVRENVAIGNAVYGIATEAGPPKDAHSIIVSLNELLNQTKMVQEHLVPQLMSIGGSLARALPAWPNDEIKNDEWLVGLNKIAEVYKPHVIAHGIGKAYPTHNPQVPAGSALVTAPLPGSRSLMFLAGELILPDKSAGGSADRAMMIQASSIILSRQKQASNLDMTKATMDTMPNNHLHQILDGVESVLNEVEKGVRAGLRTQMERMGRQLESIAERIDSNTTSDVTRLRRGLRYATVYSTWVQSPYVQLTAHDLLVCRAMMSLVSRHCAAYHR